MSPRPTALKTRVTRLLVLWLLALVLPLQGAALGVFAAKGPAHLHRAAAAPVLVLEDTRRWKPVTAMPGHANVQFVHLHNSAAKQRHLHARDDGSVMGSADATVDTDEALGTSALSVLALIPELGAWRSPERVCAAGAAVAQAMQTRCVAPLDRPPRNST